MMKGYIYKVTCLIDGKMYIGQTVRGINKRWDRHLKDANKGFEYKLYRAIRKHGVENFKIEEIMWVEVPTKQELKLKLNFLEKHFIKKFNTKENGYNMTDGGEGVVGRVYTQEFLERCRKANLGKNNPSWGKPCSEETKEKLRQYRLGKPSPMKGKKHSESAKAKISLANSGNKNPNFGKRASKITRLKLSESHKGHQLSEEHKQKISASVMRAWENKRLLNNFGYE